MISNDGYLVFLYEQTLVFEMRNQTALQRVANLLQALTFHKLVKVLSNSIFVWHLDVGLTQHSRGPLVVSINNRLED